ncbi:unnamed protein product [Cunninghamella blakesleeana]
MHKLLVPLSFLCLSSIVSCLNPIEIKGQKFFDSVTKDQFFIKGVAYQPRGDENNRDPLADTNACTRDAELMKNLGMNVVRVYEINLDKDHDACMKAFEDAGLYLLLDIATPKNSVNRKTPEYDVKLYNAYKDTVAKFAKYPHVLGFIAGNEVTNDKTNTEASAFVKAVIRDMKTFLRKTGARAIPVGYASNDDEFIRDDIKDYFVCGDTEDAKADFYGLNLYEWCGDSSFEKSGYSDRTKELENFGKPVFLSEYGCNLVRPRPFSEVETLYGSQMTSVWSGGVAYEWSQENNEYGLVKVTGTTVEPLQDYTNLQKTLKNVNPQGVKMDDYNPSSSSINCPSVKATWKATNDLPPTPSEGACSCMRDNLSCTVSDAINQSTTNSTLGNQLDTMCGLVSCADISNTNNTYGKFSFCSPQDKLSYLYNLYTKDKPAKTACDFNGYAKQASPKRKDLDTCASIPANMDGNLQSNTPNNSNSNSMATILSVSSISSLMFLSTLMIFGSIAI